MRSARFASLGCVSRELLRDVYSDFKGLGGAYNEDEYDVSVHVDLPSEHHRQ